MRGHGVAYDGVSATTANVTLGPPLRRSPPRCATPTGASRANDGGVGARGAGPLPVTWDGRDDHGQPAARGTYTLSISATTADGRAVDVTQDVTGTVARVSFDHGYPELILENGASAPISDLVSVAGRTAADALN